MEWWNIGMEWNSEVGMWNSELKEKEDFKIHHFSFQIPKSSLTHCSSFPLFQHSKSGVKRSDFLYGS